jgi:hypothetical protein
VRAYPEPLTPPRRNGRLIPDSKRANPQLTLIAFASLIVGTEDAAVSLGAVCDLAALSEFGAFFERAEIGESYETVELDAQDARNSADVTFADTGYPLLGGEVTNGAVIKLSLPHHPAANGKKKNQFKLYDAREPLSGGYVGVLTEPVSFLFDGPYDERCGTVGGIFDGDDDGVITVPNEKNA